MSYFYRHDRVDARDPYGYVAKCDCRRILIVPLGDRELLAHPAPWWFWTLYGWSIEDSRVRCPCCVLAEVAEDDAGRSRAVDAARRCCQLNAAGTMGAGETADEGGAPEEGRRNGRHSGRDDEGTH